MTLPLVLLTHPLPAEWISTLDGQVRLLVGPADPPGLAPQLIEKLPDRTSETINKAMARLMAREGKKSVQKYYSRQRQRIQSTELIREPKP